VTTTVVNNQTGTFAIYTLTRIPILEQIIEGEAWHWHLWLNLDKQHTVVNMKSMQWSSSWEICGCSSSIKLTSLLLEVRACLANAFLMWDQNIQMFDTVTHKTIPSECFVGGWETVRPRQGDLFCLHWLCIRSQSTASANRVTTSHMIWLLLMKS